ncbi:MAG TPA: hypothetical protein VN316_01125 [candidate division Zixibacteria bacterium]|nr:hypothetical protein [candidate division Zixibacteria bacterium]
MARHIRITSRTDADCKVSRQTIDDQGCPRSYCTAGLPAPSARLTAVSDAPQRTRKAVVNLACRRPYNKKNDMLPPPSGGASIRTRAVTAGSGAVLCSD